MADWPEGVIWSLVAQSQAMMRRRHGFGLGPSGGRRMTVTHGLGEHTIAIATSTCIYL